MDEKIFKVVPSFLERLESLSRPEIRLPVREDDCPAAPICEAVGNLREGCTEGSSFLAQAGSEKCMAGLILLISRLTGMWPEKMVADVERARKPIGFAPSTENQALSGKSNYEEGP